MNDSQQQLLIDLVNIHLNPNNYNDKEVVKKTASLFLFSVNDFISKSLGETFYKLPYKDISNILFQCEFDFLSETFTSFTETVLSAIEKEDEFKNSTEQEHIKECYAKFAQHISLVLVQKKFILEISINADKAAKEAKEAAEKAKNMQENMMVNYITILGIFASIIITIFGGMQIISTTTGLLQSDLNIATLILVLSFLTFLIILILWMLFTFIANLKSEGKKNYAILASLVILSVLMAISGGYMLSLKKQDAPQTNTKVLIKSEK